MIGPVVLAIVSQAAGSVEKPDWRGHGNEPLDAVTAEMLDFDRAIGAGLDFQQRNPGTLVLVVADHETGGLALDLVQDSIALMAASRQIQSAIARMAETRGFASDAQGADTAGDRRQAVRVRRSSRGDAEGWRRNAR